MKELLLKRKMKFFQYLLATSMFIVQHFADMAAFSLILGAVEKGDVQYFKKIILIIILYFLLNPLIFLTSRMLRIQYMRDTILDVRKQAFDKIIHMSFKQFSKQSREVYISNLINDINIFENKFFISFLNLLIDAGMVILTLIVLTVLDIKLALGMVILSFIMFFLARQFTKKTEDLEQQVSRSNEAFTTDMSNTFQGIEILKLNNIEDKFLRKSLQTIDALERKKCASSVFVTMQSKVIRILNYAANVAVMVYLAFRYQEGMTLMEGGLLFQLSSSICHYLTDLFPYWNQVKASVGIYEKIAKPEETTNGKEKGTKEFQFKDQIQVSHLSFSYGDRVILEDASFTIEKGKKYLIKGVSGAGKSTLMNLLAMAIEDYQGSITVDGVDYREISERSFHDKVAFIYQDVFLFEDTIKNNITLYQEVPEADIQHAVKVCGLDEILADRKDGINDRLAENGKNLSGGQRQRISIARAIAKNAEILFVDEGTSSLNESLGREIEKLFLSLEHTVIAISHRHYEGVTENYDYVLEIKNGRVNQYPGKDYFGEVLAC